MISSVLNCPEMAPMREIAASDDEESDFDHIDDPIDDAIDEIQDAPRPAPAPVQPNEAQQGNQSHHDVSNVSTDLSFFQRVYDEQRAVTIAGTYIGTNITTQAQQQPAQKSEQSSSITDPVPASRRPLKRKIGDNIIDLTELTQVTTPRKSGDGKGKTSQGVTTDGALQESGSVQQAVRTYGKTSEQKEEIPRQSTIVRIDPYEFPDDGDDDYTIPSIPKKKTKATAKRASPTSTSSLPGANPNATPDHDDISFIPLPPSEDAPSSVAQLRSYQKPISSEENVSTGSLSATAPQRLYIAPSTLTASQKEEYRIVSLSTQETQDNLTTQDNLATQDIWATHENIPPESSLPAVPPSDPHPPQMFGEGLLYTGAGTAYKSSGMTTVALSHLSDFIRDNGDGALDAAATTMMTLTSGLGSGSLEIGTPARVRTTFPASSPDVIGGASPGTRRSGRKWKASQFFEEDATQDTIPLRSSRLAKIREMSAEDNGDYAPDATDTHQASVTLGNDQLQNEQITEQPTDATALSSTIKKKRGRKKKEPVPMVTEEEVVMDYSFEGTEYQQPEVAPSEPAEPEQPPPKRRRGRPRKSDVAATQKATKQPTPAPEPDEGDELASPAPTTARKRGATDTNTRKRKASAPIVIDDSESDGNLSDPPEEMSEPEKEAKRDPFEAELEIPPSDEDEEEEEEPPRKRGRPAATAAAATVALTKGKRGRPPKNKVVQEVSASSARKNGRSKSFQAESESDDQDQDLKKDLEEEEEEGNEESSKDTREETTPVPEAKPPPSPEPVTKEEKEDKDTKKEKEIIKPTNFLSTQGKVKYRVGLSKRSRVASLLKVVPRKQ